MLDDGFHSVKAWGWGAETFPAFWFCVLSVNKNLPQRQLYASGLLQVSVLTIMPMCGEIDIL